MNVKILSLLTQIKNQNTEILAILSEKKSATGLPLDLPEDIPIKFPISSSHDMRSIELYLSEAKNLSAVVCLNMEIIFSLCWRMFLQASYYSSLGGRDVTNKTNIILRNLMSNSIAAQYSFLGSRNDKKSFSTLNLHKVVLRKFFFPHKLENYRTILCFTHSVN